MTVAYMSAAYAQLPPCVDHQGHHFTIPPMSGKSVCSRCGFIREQPKVRPS